MHLLLVTSVQANLLDMTCIGFPTEPYVYLSYNIYCLTEKVWRRPA